jgi:thymidylate synthase (FAD)
VSRIIKPGEEIKVLDHGYVKLIESWGHGLAGVPEAGIIEAARQSTQGSFRSWKPYEFCEECNSMRQLSPDGEHYEITGTDPLSLITTHKHTWKNFPSGDEGILKFLFNSNPPHATPFEFAGLVIEVQAPILVFREWHRHRTQSYNEMSARYSPLPNLNYRPIIDRFFMVDPKNKQAQAIEGAQLLTHEAALAWLELLDSAYERAEMVYQHGLRIGIPKEVARVCVPVGRYSRMRAHTNLRNWLAFMTLRFHPKAQWEIQMFAMAVGQILEQEFPRVFELFNLKRAKELV